MDPGDGNIPFLGQPHMAVQRVIPDLETSAACIRAALSVHNRVAISFTGRLLPSVNLPPGQISVKC